MLGMPDILYFIFILTVVGGRASVDVRALRGLAWVHAGNAGEAFQWRSQFALAVASCLATQVPRLQQGCHASMQAAGTLLACTLLLHHRHAYAGHALHQRACH